MDMMTEQEFDSLWQRAEAKTHSTKLMEEYPKWHGNQRRNIGIVASLVIAVAVALPMTTHPRQDETDRDYTVAFCNKADVSDAYWIEMADALLMES